MRRSFTSAELIAACALEHDIAIRSIQKRIPFAELQRQLRDMDEHHALRCVLSLKIRYTHADIFAVMRHAAKRGWVRVFRHMMQNTVLSRQEIALLHWRTQSHEIGRMLQRLQLMRKKKRYAR